MSLSHMSSSELMTHFQNVLQNPANFCNQMDEMFVLCTVSDDTMDPRVVSSAWRALCETLIKSIGVEGFEIFEKLCLFVMSSCHDCVNVTKIKFMAAQLCRVCSQQISLGQEGFGNLLQMCNAVPLEIKEWTFTALQKVMQAVQLSRHHVLRTSAKIFMDGDGGLISLLCDVLSMSINDQGVLISECLESILNDISLYHPGDVCRMVVNIAKHTPERIEENYAIILRFALSPGIHQVTLIACLRSLQNLCSISGLLEFLLSLDDEHQSVVLDLIDETLVDQVRPILETHREDINLLVDVMFRTCFVPSEEEWFEFVMSPTINETSVLKCLSMVRVLIEQHGEGKDLWMSSSPYGVFHLPTASFHDDRLLVFQRTSFLERTQPLRENFPNLNCAFVLLCTRNAMVGCIRRVVEERSPRDLVFMATVILTQCSFLLSHAKYENELHELVTELSTLLDCVFCESTLSHLSGALFIDFLESMKFFTKSTQLSFDKILRSGSWSRDALVAMLSKSSQINFLLALETQPSCDKVWNEVDVLQEIEKGVEDFRFKWKGFDQEKKARCQAQLGLVLEAVKILLSECQAK